MDIITHSVAGTAVGGVAAGRREALIAGFIGAVAPDIDSLVLVMPQLGWVMERRGGMHSVLGVLIVSLVLMLVLPRIRNVAGGPVFMAAAAGGVSHLFLDLVTPWGVPLFWPLSNEFSLGLTRGFDPWISALVLAMVIVPRLGGMTYRKACSAGAYGGRRFTVAARQQAVMIGLLIVAYLAIRFLFQGMSLREFNGAGTGDAGSYALSALNPLRWRVVVQREERTDVYRVALPGKPELRLSFPHAEGPCVEESRNCDLAGAYLERARFPHATVTRDAGTGTATVVWRDLRDQLLHTYRSGEVRVTLDCSTGEILREEKRTWLDHIVDGTFFDGGTGR